MCSTLNLTDLTVNDIKIKTICTKYKCEHNKIEKSQKNEVGFLIYYLFSK